MSCNSFQEWIALYVEGDLDPSRARNVELHLSSCTSCQHFLSKVKGSQAMVKGLAAESLDPATFKVVRQRVMQEVSRRRPARPVWWRFLSPAVAQWRPAWIAALAALVVLGFLLQRQLWRKPAGSDGADTPAAASAPAIPRGSPYASLPSPSEKIGRGQPTGEPAIRQFAIRHTSPASHDLLSPAETEPEAVAAESEPLVEQGSNLEPDAPPPADITPEPPPPLVIKLVTDDPNIVIVWLVDQDTHTN